MTPRLADYVTAEIRAEMARRRLSVPQLAARMGVAEDWVRRRVNGQYGITMDDLERINAGLDVPFGWPLRDLVGVA